MTGWRRALPWSLGLLLTACGHHESAGPPPTLVAELFSEVATLRKSSSLAWALLYLALALALSYGSARFGVWLRFVSVDGHRRFQRIQSRLAVLAVGLATLGAGRTLWLEAPVIVGLATTFAVPAIIVAVRPLVASVAGGLVVALRGVPQVGDRVRLKGHEGVVHRLGVTSVELVQQDGRVVRVPAHVLLDDELEVAPHRGAVPVVVRRPVVGAPSQERLEALRAELSFLALRRAGTPIRLEVLPVEGTLLLEVEVATADERAIASVERQIGAAIERVLAAT